jgi:hypothetical protein
MDRWIRLQGYRLSINATGRRALEACLPARHFDKLIANCAKPSDSVTFLSHHLAAVQTSLRDMERFHAKGLLARAATKSLFRAIDHVPPLKSAFLGR